MSTDQEAEGDEMPSYTTCVLPGDYEDPPLPKAGTAPATLAGLFTSLSVLEDTCDYMLHGKLVCLGGDRCAIGHVAGFETVDDKSFPDTIDNDFSINLLLSGWGLESFTYQGKKEGYELVANSTRPGSQGYLIKEQPGMPLPREHDADSWHLKDDKGNPILHSERYAGTFVKYPDKHYISYNPPEWLRGAPFEVPVLHCEIEGERAHLVCSVLDQLSHPLPGMREFCKANWFTRALCKIAQWLLTPAIAPALVTAWAAGANDNRDYMGAGSLAKGDLVAISGRWVYDAGHDGQNELHPVKTVQKVPADSAEEADDLERWCQRVGEAPPGDTGTHADPLTVEQETVATEQRQPWSRWVFHPDVDACRRPETPKKPDIR
jgi:hypothetical protein